MKETYTHPTISNTDMSTFIKSRSPIKIVINSLFKLTARPISKRDGFKILEKK